MSKRFIVKNWWIGLIFGFLGCLTLTETLLFNPEYFFYSRFRKGDVK